MTLHSKTPPRRNTELKRISAKRLKALGGRVYSTISGPRKAIPKKRPKREVQQMGSPSRRRWVRSRPCCACQVEGYSENAHTTQRSGMGIKGPATDIAPLCGPRPLNNGSLYRGCHAELDGRNGGRGRDWLESTYRIDLKACAAQTEADYQLAKARGCGVDFNEDVA